MPEVQQHGFNVEGGLIRDVYGATEEEIKRISYTSKYDLPGEFNHLDSGVNLSIKATGSKNTVCMGDACRFMEEVSGTDQVHLVVTNYEQDDEQNIKRVKETVEVNLTNAKKELFGDLEKEDVRSLDSLVKSVPQNRPPTEEEHAAMYALQKELQKKSGAIYLNIKCNSQQSRLQCSFNKFQKFLAEHPERIIARSTTNEFRGKQIQMEIPGGRRQFNQ